MIAPTPCPSPSPAAEQAGAPAKECEDLREALARVISIIDRGQSMIYRVLQQSASIRHARSMLQQPGGDA